MKFFEVPRAQAGWVATITALAADNGGFLIAEDVAAAGIDQALLSKLAARGRLEPRHTRAERRITAWR